MRDRLKIMDGDRHVIVPGWRALTRAFGQVIAEREPSDTVPMLSVTHAAPSGGTFGFSIGNHVTGSTYAAGITTRSGYHHAVFGIEPDAQRHF